MSQFKTTVGSSSPGLVALWWYLMIPELCYTPRFSCSCEQPYSRLYSHGFWIFEILLLCSMISLLLWKSQEAQTLLIRQDNKPDLSLWDFIKALDLVCSHKTVSFCQNMQFACRADAEKETLTSHLISVLFIIVPATKLQPNFKVSSSLDSVPVCNLREKGWCWWRLTMLKMQVSMCSNLEVQRLQDHVQTQITLISAVVALASPSPSISRISTSSIRISDSSTSISVISTSNFITSTSIASISTCVSLCS